MRSFNKYLFIPALTLLHIYLENSLRRPMQGTFIMYRQRFGNRKEEIFGNIWPGRTLSILGTIFNIVGQTEKAVN